MLRNYKFNIVLFVCCFLFAGTLSAQWVTNYPVTEGNVKIKLWEFDSCNPNCNGGFFKIDADYILPSEIPLTIPLKWDIQFGANSPFGNWDIGIDSDVNHAEFGPPIEGLTIDNCSFTIIVTSEIGEIETEITSETFDLREIFQNIDGYCPPNEPACSTNGLELIWHQDREPCCSNQSQHVVTYRVVCSGQDCANSSYTVSTSDDDKGIFIQQVEDRNYSDQYGEPEYELKASPKRYWKIEDECGFSRIFDVGCKEIQTSNFTCESGSVTLPDGCYVDPPSEGYTNLTIKSYIKSAQIMMISYNRFD